MESKKNTVEFYDKEKDKEVYSEALERVGSVVKEFQSDVVLYKRDKEQAVGSEEKLIKVKDAKIRVNEPLKFDNFAVYQVNFKQDEFQTMTFSLIDKKTETEHGEVTIDLFDPKTSYDLKNGYKVELLGYYPDFSGFAKNGEPQTNSPVPNNPAFLFNMISPEKPDGEVSFTAIRQTVEPLGETEYKMAFKGIGTRNATGLTVRKDLTLWVLAVGGTIFMIGVIQGSYWNHRRIWLQHKQGQLLIAGHTNKNWHSLRREITGMVEGTSIPEPIDQSQKEKNGKESRNHDAESGRTKQ